MISVEYLVLRSNVECTRLTADSETAAQISMDNTAGIKMTLTGDFEINDKVNTLTDRLQVIIGKPESADYLDVHHIPVIEISVP